MYSVKLCLNFSPSRLRKILFSSIIASFSTLSAILHVPQDVHFSLPIPDFLQLLQVIGIQSEIIIYQN